MPATNKLTPLTVSRKREPGRYADGGGLYLQVSPAKTKSWLFRFMLSGRAREMGLGPVDIVSLSEARDAARGCRKLLLAGVDPIEARRLERLKNQAATAKLITFRECAEKYIAAHEGSWRNEKHRAQWTSTLKTYAYPTIGALAVATVDTSLVIGIVEPLWSTKPETAGRVRGRIESVLDWARVREYRQGENPARWKGHLDHLLPKRSKVARVKHHPALPYPDLPRFMNELRARKGLTARALEFTILTVARTGATVGATLEEVDVKARVWTVPAERTGAKITGQDSKPKRVPLSARALAILKALPREEGNPYLFIGAKAGQPLSNMAMLELLREMRPGYVPHGFRSTFKDWCSETTNYPNEVSEAALWHVVADRVEAAYRRGDLFQKRRALMSDWAAYCGRRP
ncbi:integrase arm-type DNA-binding domain-containing protein [Bradyrhizobium sp. 186]|uniref:tyrosine-type recombinase/integrase n=1 Tax=Bradyrhizobium sp. 186 TaxID=2782654 RepID=UPI0020006975|nr:site-specific integrase [Bradyrhizobium sp. 186]UPK35548.1 integrase arm-type DNA-binding domain-containing protein [Bradyrhizobium sp. 186]